MSGVFLDSVTDPSFFSVFLNMAMDISGRRFQLMAAH